MISTQIKYIYVDPTSPAYYDDRLFDHANPILNRDDTLAPFIRLRRALESKNIRLHTADRLLQPVNQTQVCDYYSLGVLTNYKHLSLRDDVRLRAFVIFEPPIVDPRLYRALPELTAAFERVYVHNTEGDGYSLKGVDQSKLHQLYWPQPHKDVMPDFWNRGDRLNRIVMINGNHKPASYHGELYSARIEALVELSVFDKIDLYGRGWERWWSRSAMWLPYWRHKKTLLSIYKGACQSKYEVLSQYNFALCFENMAMNGYITEKIFDCLYAGTIPLYLGAKDVSELLPKNIFIDCRKFSSLTEMHHAIIEMSEVEIQSMRTAGRAFIQSGAGSKYYDSLISIFE